MGIIPILPEKPLTGYSPPVQKRFNGNFSIPQGTTATFALYTATTEYFLYLTNITISYYQATADIITLLAGDSNDPYQFILRTGVNGQIPIDFSGSPVLCLNGISAKLGTVLGAGDFCVVNYAGFLEPRQKTS